VYCWRVGGAGCQLGDVGGTWIFTDALKYYVLFGDVKPYTYFYPVGWLNYESIFY